MIWKYSCREYGWFKMWKSLLDKPTHPKQYEEPEHPTERTKYEDPLQSSQSVQW